MLSLSENPLYWLLNEEISVHYAKLYSALDER